MTFYLTSTGDKDHPFESFEFSSPLPSSRFSPSTLLQVPLGSLSCSSSVPFTFTRSRHFFRLSIPEPKPGSYCLSDGSFTVSFTLLSKPDFSYKTI